MEGPVPLDVLVQNGLGYFLDLAQIRSQVRFIWVVNIPGLYHVRNFCLKAVFMELIQKLHSLSPGDQLQRFRIPAAQAIFPAEPDVVFRRSQRHSTIIKLIGIDRNILRRKSAGVHCGAAHPGIRAEHRVHIQPSLPIGLGQLRFSKEGIRERFHFQPIGSAEHDRPLPDGDGIIRREGILPGPLGDPVLHGEDDAVVPGGGWRYIPEHRRFHRSGAQRQLQTEHCGCSRERQPFMELFHRRFPPILVKRKPGHSRHKHLYIFNCS